MTRFFGFLLAAWSAALLVLATPLPVCANELVWQTVPNVAMSTSGADSSAANKNEIWSLAAELDGNTDTSVWNNTCVIGACDTGKWRHCGSNDGSTDTTHVTAPSVGCAGTDWWGATSSTFALNSAKIVANTGNNPHSTYILESPAAITGSLGVPVYLNIDVTSATAPALYISKTMPTSLPLTTCVTNSASTTVTCDAFTTARIVQGQEIRRDSDNQLIGIVNTVSSPTVTLYANAASTNSPGVAMHAQGGARGRWTAADEFGLGTGLESTWASPSQYRTHLSVSTRGDFWWFTSRDTQSKFYQVFGVTLMQDAKSGDAMPVVGVSASNAWNNTNSTPSTSLSGTDAGYVQGRDVTNGSGVKFLMLTLAYYCNYSGSGILADIVNAGYVLGGNTCNGSPMPGTGLTGADYSDGKFDGWPIYLVSSTTNYVSQRGRLADLLWAPSTMVNLTVVPVTSPYGSVVYGTGVRSFFPWATSAVPTP